MTLLFQLLVATLLIAGMILIRVFANRYALRQRLDCSRAGDDCGGCEGEEKRSACHAP
jgi:hypothetical protein